MSGRTMLTAMLPPAGPRRRHSGFTLIELVIVICIVSVMSVVAADRFLYWQERAEKAAMESVLSGVKMGLQIRMAETMAANRLSVAELQNEDPIRWLQEAPADYEGAYTGRPQAGKWYFSAKERELVYIPNNRQYLKVENEPVELRFKVVIREDTIGDGSQKTPTGISLASVTPYRWF